ncbi:MAG: MFS transporter [Chthoniobacteraceae bacterium]
MSAKTEGIAPNASRLLWAGFMAILAAGVGYSVRGGILGQWAEQFGFTMSELGAITGGGLTGFGIVIILGSLIADKVGYGKLMITAFVLHFLSAVITLAAPAAFAAGGKDAAFNCLFYGMFIFAIGNGLAETVVNPLTATLYPNNKTHFLNILHAGWPAGLVLGGLAGALMAGKPADPAAGAAAVAAVDWKIQMSLFIIPVVIYGVMLLGQKFPKSEAESAGVTLGQMVSTVFAPLMLVLLVTHALVGYVELGTDSWISKITGSIMGSPAAGLKLFVYTSMLMFLLRFVAGPIVHQISPLGLLFVSAVLGAIGLTLLGSAATVTACIVAATVYALGKTFLWPTMLAVASERFPKGGAVAIGMLGGVGMLSAGLLGGPAIGFKQDYHASANLETTAPDAYSRYKAGNEKAFFGFKTVGLDGAKVGVLEDGGKELNRAGTLLAKENKQDANHAKLAAWWETAQASADADKKPVQAAGIHGGKTALKLTAYVPMAMAVIYLLLIIYFKATGGYKALHVSGEQIAGGVQGPGQG